MAELKFNGYLGLNEVETIVGSKIISLEEKDIIVNLSEVNMIDVAGLLLLLVWLQSFRNKGWNIRFKLPDITKQRKVRDFLVKWRFDRALLYTFNDDLTRLIDADQMNYFDEPLKFYTDAGLYEEYGELAVLKSHNLLEIIPLTELTQEGNSRVSKAKINSIADSLSLQAVTPIIQAAVGASANWSMRFGKNLVYQALLNVFEHPDATVAFIAIAKKPNFKENSAQLVISVADNGLTISDTIHKAYLSDSNISAIHKIEDDSLESQYKMNSNKIVYATRKYTSSKPLNHPDPDRGMGLYYLKTMTSEVNGETIIRCRNTSVRFKADEKGHLTRSYPRRVEQLEKGNIIRITIPIVTN
jgi:hypothetical protein